MSLINDALKRAESEKRAAQSSAPLQPVESAPSHSTSPLLLGGIFLLGIGAIGIAAALWFGGRTTQAPSSHSAPSQEPLVGSAVAADLGTQVSTAPQQVSPTQPTTPTVASNPAPSTPNPIATTTPPKNLAATPPTTSAQSRPVRLQSIFYRLKNPTVIINGKTLGVGDTFDDIKVVSIQRTSVEIVQDGKYRTLTLQY